MSQPDSTPAPSGNPRRRRALAAVAGLVVVAGVGYGVYWALVLNHFETTDNAYVQGDVVQLTPQIGGTVVAIGADDTDHVKAGQTLVRLDPADAEVALEQAQAQLAQTVREVRTLYANNGSLGAQVALRAADVTRAKSDVARAQDDVNRRTPLLATGAVGREEFEHSTAQLAAARSGLAAAESALRAAREQLASNQALTDGVAVDTHPNVLRAASKVREAWLALRRTELAAPVDGYVARRSVQLGQRVQAGTPLLSVIPLGKVWIEANFKESQLRSLRIGQPVELKADVYGGRIVYHGRVEGLGAGTGAAFALLPAQNASGNWIKVVQRVPVRITLDPAEVTAHPLRVGLSMEARVDVHDTSGAMLASQPPAASTTARTTVFDENREAADEQVRRIIAANLGRADTVSAPGAPRPGSALPATEMSRSAAVPAPLAQSAAARPRPTATR